MVTIDNIMKTFREYVVRRDEASYNPLQGLRAKGGKFGDIGDTVATIGYPFAAAGGSLPAVAGGLGQTAGKYRSMVRGNPYISDTPERTKALAGKAFNDSSGWLLNYVAGQKMPKVHQGLITFLHQSISELEEHFRTQQPKQITGTGVMVGKQPTTLGNIFALPVSIISGIKAAAKNVIDTFNPAYQTQSNAWIENVNKMVLSLDALNTWEKELSGQPPQLIDSYIQTFLHNLEKGWDARAREIGTS